MLRRQLLSLFSQALCLFEVAFLLGPRALSKKFAYSLFASFFSPLVYAGMSSCSTNVSNVSSRIFERMGLTTPLTMLQTLGIFF